MYFIKIVARVIQSYMLDVVESLAGMGGKELVLQQDNEGNTAVHIAIFEGISYRIIERLVDTGGKDLGRKQDNDGNTALHIACTVYDRLVPNLYEN